MTRSDAAYARIHSEFEQCSLNLSRVHTLAMQALNGEQNIAPANHVRRTYFAAGACCSSPSLLVRLWD